MGEVKYNKLPPLLSEEIIQRASKLSSAQLADGMKGLGLHRDGCMHADIMPVNESMKTIGTAYTVSTENGDNLPIHIAVYQGKPGYVLIVDGKGHEDHAYMGDLLISAAQAIGINGVVVDGCVRDKSTLNKLNFPVFARGFMQRGPSKNIPGEINVDITCGGVKVCPGDLVFGDYDGVTIVPRDIIEAVLVNAEKKDAYENERRSVIEEYIKCKEEGRKTPDLVPNWVNEMIYKCDDVCDSGN